MLADRYRPEAWTDVAGNERAVRSVARLTMEAAETGESLVLLLSGPPGVGKSSLAALVAKTLGAPAVCIETVASGCCDKTRVEGIAEEFAHTSLYGSGWRVAVVEECDKMSDGAFSLFLTLLETLPRKRAVVFTSNLPPDRLYLGGDELQRRRWGAFLSRAYGIVFTNKGLARDGNGRPGPAARRLHWIAQKEGARKSLDWCADLLTRCEGNLRMAIHQLRLEA
ncbi:MAG TPA: AAA family ATPase [Planctomycetota bacterium]|nr:AAA family ATPase [Planctomycetota bacterium]HRR83255.1 AAA family ATPase [Planctomycetota bacterium]HRT97125.1 AAA family ATPase [Planctomycetota bacterium]